jgi:ribosomal protein L37AE/L43A
MDDLDLFGDRVTSTGPPARRCPRCQNKAIQGLGGWTCTHCDWRKYDQAHARGTDPKTSHEAAASLDPETLRETQREVLELFERYGPMADIDLLRQAEHMGSKQSPSGLRTRRHELTEKGFLRASGNYIVNKHRRHIEWELVS